MAVSKTTDDAGHAERLRYLEDGRGLKSWRFTPDPKRIGLMYLVVFVAAFFVAALGPTEMPA